VSELGKERISTRWFSPLLFVSISVIRVSLLVGGNLWQRRREQAFLFFLGQRQTCGCDHGRRDEDDQVLFVVLLDIGAKGTADDREDETEDSEGNKDSGRPAEKLDLR